MRHAVRSLATAVTLYCASLAVAASAGAQAAPEPADKPNEKEAKLETIVVTAGKRQQSLSEVAGSVSAVTGGQLEDIGAQSLADYIQRTPGVVFNNYQPGVSHVVIRGIATNSGNVQGQPTTGYFVNEIPLTEPGWTIAIPDIDTFDLDRVEVLRGPQGSLFGSASMGGAINYIVNTADATRVDAAAESTISSTHNADVGYTAKAMVNLPLISDVLAIRAVVDYRKDPGYLDNIGTGVKGSNDTTIGGGRFSAVWTPNEDTKLSWLSIVQRIDADDNAYQMPAYGDLKRKTAVPEFTNTKIDIHSLRFDQNLGWSRFTALASYQKKQQDWRYDFSPLRSAYNSDLKLNLTTPLYINSGGASDGRSIELRLASPEGGGKFEWLVGTMYYDTSKNLYEQLGAQGAAAQFDQSPMFGPGSGAVIAPDGRIFNAFYTHVDGSEAALFGEASYLFTPEWKLTVGGRFFRNEVESTTRQQGFSTYPGAPKISSSKTDDDGFNPKVSLSYTPHERLMFYGLVSEGFRFGEPNTPGLSKYPMPQGSTSDKLTNYELGMRSNWLDRTLQFDATAFYVDWSRIQLRLQTPDFFNYATNGGKAYSRGIELSTHWRPSTAFDWQSSVTWQHARLDQDLFILFAGTAPAGSRLPGSADWSISNVLTYRFDARWYPTLTFSHSYLSQGISDLNSAVPGVVPNKQGGYSLFDLRFRMSFDKTDVTLYGANLTDKRGITRSVSEINGLGQGIVRPRTFGVTFLWRL